MGLSASVQPSGSEEEVERFSITIERTELSGFRWQIEGEAHLHPADLAELRRWLTDARQRGQVAAFTIVPLPAE